MINAIIFSKDRPAQLDLLARSIEKFVTPLQPFKVLWTGSDQYLEVFEKHSFLLPYREIDFKEDLMNLFNLQSEYTMFLVDDDVFIRPVNITEDLGTVNSLRLGTHIKYCYSRDMAVMTPETLEFDWRNAQGDFGYPMSLDGNITKTSLLTDMIKTRHYNNPNTLETALAAYPYIEDMVKMKKLSSLVGNAVNKVQSTYDNRSGSTQSAEYLNEMYSKGYQLKLEPFEGMIPIAPHVQQEYEFEKQA